MSRPGKSVGAVDDAAIAGMPTARTNDARVSMNGSETRDGESKPYTLRMAVATGPGLTKLSFRRDVRMFLIVLVSFNAVIIFFLLFLLLGDVDSAEDTFHTQQAEAADAATLEIRDALQSGEPLDAQLVAIRARHGFEAVEVRTPGVAPRMNGRGSPAFDFLERTIGTTKIRYSFDAAA